ncbi:hypothetical protein ZPAH1_orf00383 [Aeromonas phage ZPAH1]|nr:hypothetical protein ASwh1_338 [Aeromonas phage Aswh_1]QQG34145.1 hypothetical protein ZPAH1_orf00383 [Aeromonas phage ZPAH1]
MSEILAIILFWGSLFLILFSISYITNYFIEKRYKKIIENEWPFIRNFYDSKGFSVCFNDKKGHVFIYKNNEHPAVNHIIHYWCGVSYIDFYKKTRWWYTQHPLVAEGMIIGEISNMMDPFRSPVKSVRENHNLGKKWGKID